MFEKFSVIDLIKTRSASVCTFAGNVVKFNVQTAQELRFPEYIQFLIEPKSKQFAIRACKEDARMPCASPSRRASRKRRSKSATPRLWIWSES